MDSQIGRRAGKSPIGDQEELVNDYHKIDGTSCHDYGLDSLKFAVDTEENQGKINNTKLPNPEFCPKSFDCRPDDGIEFLPFVIQNNHC
jgi:hypothetical protein